MLNLYDKCFGPDPLPPALFGHSAVFDAKLTGLKHLSNNYNNYRIIIITAACNFCKRKDKTTSRFIKNVRENRIKDRETIYLK